MNRRGFLGSIFALGAAPAIVQASNLMPGKVWTPLQFNMLPSPVSVPPFQPIREYAFYDALNDRTIFRYDAITPAAQVGVDMVLRPGESMKDLREMAIRMIGDGIKREGLTWADLKPPPMVKIGGVFRGELISVAP